MTSILHPPVEGAAFDAFLQGSAPASRHHERWRPDDGVMPALYLSHGAPPVFNDAHWMDQLFAWSRSCEEGVLIIGSGYMTHGLPFLGRDSWERNVIPGWSRDFDAWAAQALAAGRIDLLADFRHAPGMPYAHPTVEHYTPIFVTFGAATDPSAPPKVVIDDFQMGLAKRSFQVA
jgi:aromatic ring-opening dioxygenase catalytic subunit (LigB family)